MNQYQSILIQETYFCFHENRLAIKSGRNLSKKVRFSLVGMYHDVNSRHFKSAKKKFIFRGKSPKKYFKEYKEKWK